MPSYHSRQSLGAIAPEKMTCAQMPLAIYREVKAHLQQVEGVEVELCGQSSQTFAYRQSQVEGLIVACDRVARERIEFILAYYAEKYGAWERTELNEKSKE